MSIINVITNQIKAAIGYKQNFDELIASGDINRAITYMEDRTGEVEVALKESDVNSHEIMSRQDKAIHDKNGNFVRYEKRWKLPVPYQAFINEIALVFLYGRPVKWMQKTKDTDVAFEAFTDMLKTVRFDSKIRQAKRMAGAETESAMLFRVFRTDDDKSDCQVKVLAKSLGDEIKIIWDEYGNMVAFGWGYYTKSFSETMYNFNIYTADSEYHCKRGSFLKGWEITTINNEIGKIPVIYFRQNKEHEGVQYLIDREEFVGSKTADVNDYFADPIAILDASVIKNMPEKKEEAKLLIVDSQKGVDAAKYLTWDSASESKENEMKWLEKHILTKSFTPNFDYESLKGISTRSGKALQQMMLLADIKSAKQKETHDELLDRVAGLCKSIIGNILNISLKSEMDKLIINHEFQAPFGEDIVETITTLSKAYEIGGISLKTFVELNPLVKDAASEMDRLKSESAEKAKLQSDVFSQVN
jgi:SPP1 family phage portal protein